MMGHDVWDFFESENQIEKGNYAYHIDSKN